MTTRNTDFPIPKSELYYYDDNESIQKPLVDTDGLVKVNVENSDIMQPVEIQSRIQTTVQTHNGVTVSPSGNSSNSTFIDTNGFTDIGITVLNDSNTAQFAVTVLWSNDGANVHGAEAVLNSAVAVWSNSRSVSVPTKARYFKIVLINSDASAPHIMSAWAYLKA